MPTAHAYLDGPAAKLTGTYPDCSDYIAGLLEKYKTTLTVGSPHIGDTPEEVTASFEKDVRKHCIRNKTDGAS
jgi:hypothetical protein